ncbi:MAG: cytochrome-c peroxidase [Planctomycetota bacterium]|nr:MAG: cytochrome-c peroxidase [Planctomycetota bacterium]
MTPLRLLPLLPLLLLLPACGGSEEDAAAGFDRARLAVFGELPEFIEHPEYGRPSEAMIRLGEKLYRDPRLSADDSISCNSCHDLDRAGVDGKPFSEGVGGQLGGRNAPTVFHAAGHVAQFWDGRAADVEEQAKGPILNPVEMAMESPEAVMAKLGGIPGYREAFAEAFPDDPEPFTYDNLGRAIGAFERGLVVRSAFDEFLAGDDDALTPQQKEGLDLFLSTGCASCHNGPYVGGGSFRKLGEVEPWPGLTDNGRMEATGNEADRYFFKVPSLRLITRTGPYLHDGSIADLREMIRKMARHQLGVELSDDQVDSIAVFLGSLG